MNIPASILAGATIIVLAILIAFHWQTAAFGGETYRLNRWTGTIEGCTTTNERRLGALEAGVGVTYRCGEPTATETQAGKIDPSIK